MKLGIINYGMGNIYSLKSAITKVKPDAAIIYSNEEDELKSCDKLFLPGVGNFKLATEKLDQLGLREIIMDEVVDNGKPILGICLGMQLLFERSEEGGNAQGLGLLNGQLERFDLSLSVKIPHMGFNQIDVHNKSILMQDVDHLDFYFVHSYRVKEVSDRVDSYATCWYGEEFVAAVERQNIFGVQFHPEKSQANGLSVLENFIKA